jgi:3-deoxy-D-manno-octulosonic-acid transferase
VPSDDAIYLLDTMGELASLYREAALAFVGGSLTASGGHNPIEAWREGVSTLVGPHTQSFREITQRGGELGILQVIHDAEQLREQAGAWLADRAAAVARAETARRFVAESRGAAERTVGLLASLVAQPPRRATRS